MKSPSAQLSHALTRIHAAMHRPSSPAPAPPSSPPCAGSPPDDATRRSASRRASQERTAELLQQSFRPKAQPSAPAHAWTPIPGMPDSSGGSERRRGAMRSSSGPREGRFGGGPPRGTESPAAPGRVTLRKQLSSDIAPLLLRLKRQATPTRIRSQSPVLSPVQSPRDVWEAAEAGKLFNWMSKDTECIATSARAVVEEAKVVSLPTARPAITVVRRTIQAQLQGQPWSPNSTLELPDDDLSLRRDGQSQASCCHQDSPGCTSDVWHVLCERNHTRHTLSERRSCSPSTSLRSASCEATRQVLVGKPSIQSKGRGRLAATITARQQVVQDQRPRWSL